MEGRLIDELRQGFFARAGAWLEQLKELSWSIWHVAFQKLFIASDPDTGIDLQFGVNWTLFARSES